MIELDLDPSEFDDDFQVTVWDQDMFQVTYSALDSLLEALNSSDSGVSGLRPDDLIIRRGRIESAGRITAYLSLGCSLVASVAIGSPA